MRRRGLSKDDMPTPLECRRKALAAEGFTPDEWRAEWQRREALLLDRCMSVVDHEAEHHTESRKYFLGRINALCIAVEGEILAEGGEPLETENFTLLKQEIIRTLINCQFWVSGKDSLKKYLETPDDWNGETLGFLAMHRLPERTADEVVNVGF